MINELKVNTLDRILTETLKSGRDISAAKVIKLDFSASEKDDRIGNAKWERESKFKKIPDDHIVMQSNEGFFFHYNPDKNVYFESNGSFVFIIGVATRKSYKSRYFSKSSPYKVEQITHDDIGYDDINFRVNKKTKKIYLEKRWEDTKLRANTIDDPEAFRDAVKIAVREHSELKEYTFVPLKMKVSEYTTKAGAAALEAGGEQKAYIAVLGDRFKEIKQDGLKERKENAPKTQMFFDKKTAEKEAKRISDTKRISDSNKLYHVWVIAEVIIKSDEEVGEKWEDRYELGKAIPPERIKLIKTNMPRYFEESWKPAKRLTQLENLDINKTLYGSNKRFPVIAITKDEEDWEYFQNNRAKEKYTKRRGRRKGPLTKRTYNTFPEANELVLRNGIKILIFRPKTTTETVKKFIAFHWLEGQSIWAGIRYDMKEEGERDMGYELYFNRRAVPSLQKIIIEKSFEKGTWGIESVEKLLKTLGIDY